MRAPTDRINEGRELTWQVAARQRTVDGVLGGYGREGERVKRPGPGGEGRNINPYAERPLARFLDVFGRRVDMLPDDGLRHRSTIVQYEGVWSRDFLKEVSVRRGYRLEPATCPR